MNCSKCGTRNEQTHKFCSECGTPLSRVENEAERRSLTVMFCDLAGSTALSESIDPEDLQQILTAYQDCCRTAIHYYGGFIARYMGDGLLVYFGYPKAHEDDAKRAIRASLEIIKTVPKLATDVDCPLAVRIGIATGDVVIGDIIGEGAAEEMAVLGLTPNLAARLQSVAGENQIVVGNATRQRLGDIVLLHDLGEFSLKGITAPVQAWQIGDLTETSRQNMSSAPFVGREEVFSQFAALLERSTSGSLEIIHLGGQAGIGKTRFIKEFIGRIGDIDSEVWTCSAFHSNVPLHPLPGNVTELIKSQSISGEAQRQFLFDAITTQLVERAKSRPLVLIIEDAHWIDPTTIDYLLTVNQRLAGLPLLIVVAARPGETADYLADKMGGARIVLHALPITESQALIKSLVGDGVSEESCQKISERAGGIPLFLEELTNVISKGEGSVIPDSLQESLLARLDSLGASKRLAQLAAMFGRSFSLDDLCNLSDCADKNRVIVEVELNRLINEGVFVEVGEGYSFRHALMREVAYETLLNSTRRRLHGEIAENLVAGVEANLPELVALHLVGAGRTEDSIVYWCDAAHHSAQLWSHTEASAYYRDALTNISEQTDEKLKLSIHLDLVDSLRIIDQYEVALTQLDQAEALIKIIGSDEDELRLHVLRGNIYFPLGDAERCILSHQAAVEVAKRLGYPEAEARAMSGIADAHFVSGKMISAEKAYNDCVTIAEHHGLNAVTLSNVSLRGHMRLYLCRIKEAEEDSRRAVKMAIELGNRRAELTARGSCLGKVLIEKGDFSEADTAFATAAELATSLGSHRYEALNLVFQGKVALETGRRSDAMSFGSRAVMIARQSGRQFCLPLAIGVVACAEQTPEACRDALAEAEAVIAEGCLAHNPLWFYRYAAVASIAHHWPGEARRFGGLLRARFASEPNPWCNLIATGADAMADQLENNDNSALLGVIDQAESYGFEAWAITLKRAAALSL